ncbi:hypothetical protein C8Q78DRAFT_1069688 [Trametes maxima]|nr:hypothetical protein C8Q78DRAFT_1069688 [Trametes maxima]
MKFTLFTTLAATLAAASGAALRPIARTDTDPVHGQITAPAPNTHIAPGAAFNFSYDPSADYCRSTYACSVWLVTGAPTALAPADEFFSGHFFGRFDYPNYPAVPYPKNPAPAQLTMPDFSKSPGGFGSSRIASDQTVNLVVLEEWSGCEIDVRVPLTHSPV